jgi:hypothetical protein
MLRTTLLMLSLVTTACTVDQDTTQDRANLDEMTATLNANPAAFGERTPFDRFDRTQIPDELNQYFDQPGVIELRRNDGGCGYDSQHPECGYCTWSTPDGRDHACIWCGSGSWICH